jgi:uncharacterized RDD family membrane protein YckC
MKATTLPAPGLKRRLACLAYECLLIMALLLVPSALFTWLKAVIGASFWLDKLLQLALLAVLFSYFGLSWVHGGQTVAMKAWRLKLETADGGRLGWSQACVRFVVALLLVVGVPVVAYLGMGRSDPGAARIALLWCLVPFLWSYFDPQGQYLHDRLCGTRMRLQPKTPPDETPVTPA